MGRQVGFYATVEDFGLLEPLLCAVHPFLTLHSWSPSSSPRVSATLLTAILEAPLSCMSLYLTREGDLNLVKMKHFPTRLEWHVDDSTSPVIQCVGPSIIRDGFMSSGRLYYQTGFYDSKGRWIGHSSEFLKWGEALFRRVKRCFSERVDSMYVGPFARKWADETGGGFRQYHTRSQSDGAL